MSSTVGFVGLGAIGRPMARNLVQKGFDMMVCDIDADRAQAVATEIGARVATWPADLVPACGLVIVMVPDAPEVEAVCFGERGIASARPRDLLVVNTTTMDPDRSKAVAARAGRHGFRLLEAPVTRGVAGAEEGRLCFFIGGDTTDLERARPALEAMGTDLRHVGDIGEGLAMKLVHNVVSITTSTLLGEAIALGSRWGLSKQKMFEYMQDCNADSYQFRLKLPRMIAGDFRPGFAIDLAHKDLSIILAIADQLKTCLPLAATARETLGAARARGLGGLDTCATLLLYEDQGAAGPGA
jgi:3-hydroxyisobutyrate dehydrogenase-like beta-hydroxyacid dehydrogenase